MAVVSSGQIRLNADVNIEINGSLGSNVSLTTLSTGASKSAPHGLFEFYGYSSVTAPSVTTNAITGVTVTSMTLNGNVTSDGGGTVTQRGFYFGTSSNITSNPKYTSGSGTGTFSLNRSVSASTTYYCAAYAINSAGETRGSTTSATSQAAVPVTTNHSTNLLVLGHNGDSMATNQVVYVNYYVQYNHPTYGYSTSWSTNTYNEGSGYGYGISGYQNYNVYTYKRSDTGASLCQRVGHYAELYNNNLDVADWSGSSGISYQAGGMSGSSNCSYSGPQPGPSWPSGLGVNNFSPSYGGGETYWNYTGCCYTFYATGSVDTRY